MRWCKECGQNDRDLKPGKSDRTGGRACFKQQRECLVRSAVRRKRHEKRGRHGSHASCPGCPPGRHASLHYPESYWFHQLAALPLASPLGQTAGHSCTSPPLSPQPQTTHESTCASRWTRGPSEGCRSSCTTVRGAACAALLAALRVTAVLSHARRDPLIRLSASSSRATGMLYCVRSCCCCQLGAAHETRRTSPAAGRGRTLPQSAQRTRAAIREDRHTRNRTSARLTRADEKHQGWITTL
ncbi:hypothetical protein M011DRAFT_265212 [Sporormia fimetaria CBS 119925]|uniref:Uncharacterized protein n=1 Tax=Sporormia fimetaria CBS 119925 TaxID=1340428 RepID=A0A6A6UXQ4_9PLEO|nr:hypothetical protein M011DRAFT_265212 [Sporormia fimetaria CBS 119925]